jgi:hypothetical protein
VPPMMLRILRVLRVLRLVRLVKNAKGVLDLVVTLILSFPALMNVAGLLGLVLFMYSVLGTNLFTYVLLPGMELNAHRNFWSVPSAFLVLFQCLTNDAWSLVMDDLTVTPERGCHPEGPLLPDGTHGPCDCGYTVLPAAYFFSFLLLCNFVLLNIVVAVVIDNFLEMRYWNPRLCSEHDITEYAERWGDLDPTARGFLSRDDCAQLLLSLPPPLGLREDADPPGRPLSHSAAVDYLNTLDLPASRAASAPRAASAAGGNHNGTLNRRMVDFATLLNALIIKTFEKEEVEAPEEVVAAVSPQRQAMSMPVDGMRNASADGQPRMTDHVTDPKPSCGSDRVVKRDESTGRGVVLLL